MTQTILTTSYRIVRTIGQYTVTADATYDAVGALIVLAGGNVSTADCEMPVATFDGFGASLSIYYNTTTDRAAILGTIEVFTNAIQQTKP
jgi:hypothetical protein|nr:MAG TPA: hypothetical protein [Caudoviricetes sp.]